MKYMIQIYGTQEHYDAMSGKPSTQPTWSQEDLQAMFLFMDGVNAELRQRGEFVDGQGLAEPVHARRVQLKDGVPVVTDGPYAESREVLAGYWIVDVDSFDRATEIAAKVTTCPGPGGQPAGGPVDVRLVLEAPAEA